VGDLPQTPLGELTALPRLPSWNKGDLLLRDLREGARKGHREGKRRRRREGKRRESPCVFLNFP